jgi:hypothetical protein
MSQPDLRHRRYIHTLKTILFHIPAYQRGYKWKKEDVQLLLDDIVNSTHHYCLQPIVVAKQGSAETDSEKGWTLIDGQQRLTTLNLILRCLGDVGIPLHYETREDNTIKAVEAIFKFDCEANSREDWKAFLKMPENRDLDHVDTWHLFHAYMKIKEFVANSDARRVLHDKILTQVFVLWHEVDSAKGAIEFQNFNSGRIALTPSELLKARFLQSSMTVTPDVIQRSPAEIAAQWQEIEQTLNESNFWAFLNPPKPYDDHPNRISLLWDTLYPAPNPSAIPATAAWQALKKDADLPKAWLDIWNLFLTFRDWFEAPDLCREIGFLRHLKGNAAVGLEALASERNKGKSEFASWRQRKIQEQLETSEEWQKWQYGERSHTDKLQNLLFWFNLQCLPRQMRYPFDLHRATDWSLEHIHSQTPSEKDDVKVWKQWLDYVMHPSKEGSVLRERFDKEWTTKGKPKREELEEEDFKLAKQLATQMDDPSADVHGIGNLALLSKSDNSALGNLPFPLKREAVVTWARRGEFIPPATLWVFLKAFGDGSNTTDVWDATDRKAYVAAIEEVISNSFQSPS